jgi:glycosyltransferase involved in cell wall biosynthesis
MNQPLVSIIIPIYNAELYLTECIESVINQTYCNIEIILVNDGSKDKSFEICTNYTIKDLRITLINQENKGVGVARNNGLLIAKGSYLLFLDADDWIEENFFEKTFSEIENGTDLIVFGYTKSNKEGKKINSIIPPQKFGLNIHSSKNMLVEILQSGVGLAIWDKLIKRDIIVNNNIQFNKKISGEDFEFCLKLLENSKSISSINISLYNYRINILGKRNTNYDILENHLEIFNRINFFFEDAIHHQEVSNYINSIFNIWFLKVIPINVSSFNLLNRREKIALISKMTDNETLKTHNYTPKTLIDKIINFIFIHKFNFTLLLLGSLMNFIRKIKFS